MGQTNNQGLFSNPFKSLKQTLSIVMTAMLFMVLFAVIFVTLDLVEISANYFIEMAIVTALTVQIKLYWYPYGEEARLKMNDIIDTTKDYDIFVETNIKDIEDLDYFLCILNKENRDNYIHNKIGYKTHTKNKKYLKKYYKVCAKADKLHKIKSVELLTRCESKYITDSRNYAKIKKVTSQTISTIGSVIMAIALASIAFKQLMLNWTTCFRYLSYVFTMVSTIVLTMTKAYKITGEETLDYLARLQHIGDRYVNYKENREVL